MQHDLLGGESLLREPSFEPAEGRRDLRILIAQLFDQLGGEQLRQGVAGP